LSSAYFNYHRDNTSFFISGKRKNALSPAHGAQGSYLPHTAVLWLQWYFP